MAEVGEIRVRLSAGFIRAPWWGLLATLFQILTAIGASEARAFAIIIPLCGLGWTRIGEGRRHWFILRPAKSEGEGGDAL